MTLLTSLKSYRRAPGRSDAADDASAAAALPADNEVGTRAKSYFDISPREWLWDTLFMLSLSLTGLAMPLGNLLVIILLIREFKIDREGFIVKLMLTLGGYAITSPNTQWLVNVMFLLFPAAFFAMAILRKPPLVKKTVTAYLLFAAVTVVMSVLWGVEGLYTQLRQMMQYLSFCFFAIPLVTFSGESFDIHKMWKKLFSLMIIMSAFYILDGFIVKGWLFVPCSWIDYEGSASTWMSPIIRGIGGVAPRKFHPGLYPMAMLVYPIAKYYKLRWWQWALVLGAFGACRTASVIFGLVIGLILAQGTFKKYLIYLLSTVALVTVLYFVDDSMGYTEESEQSTMRIASTVNQFFSLSEMEDEEDLSEAGTGRMAQVIPSWEYIFDTDREMVGFGFVNNDTENPYLIVESEFVKNPEFKYQAVTNVEITYARQFFQFGLIGLIVWLGFMFGIYWIIRHLGYAQYYINVLIVLMIFSLAQIDVLTASQGMFILAMTYTSILLNHKSATLSESSESQSSRSYAVSQR